MGLLIDGVWHDQWYDTKASNGQFERKESSFRHWVTTDGSAGITGKAGFKAEAGRYHLYVSLACPWAHRTMIFRQLKGLENIISMSIVNAFMGEQGWSFKTENALGVPFNKDVIADDINHANFLHQIYTKAQSNFTGRVTVPVLWDKQTQTIVSNESSEIIRMFNSAFDQVGAKEEDYYPKNSRSEIDAWNNFIYPNINNGVYRAGFATTQQAYEEGVNNVFSALDKIEQHLHENHFLAGDNITEADWRLFTTLIRFDSVYVGHFKCNLKRIVDYPKLSHYLQRLYQIEGIKQTVNIENIKAHYYVSHPAINPTRVIPKGPDVSFLM